MMNSKKAWATGQDPVSKNERKRDREREKEKEREREGREGRKGERKMRDRYR
jgi:hypothetical protein